MFQTNATQPVLTLRQKYDLAFKKNYITWGICFIFLIMSILSMGTNIFTIMIISFLAYDALAQLKSIRINIKTQFIATAIAIGINIIICAVWFILCLI